jgi:short-subunit dehydrogenase
MRYAMIRVLLLALIAAAISAAPWPVLLVAAVGLLLPLGLLTNRTQPTALSGASVLVTGASSGLGRQLALEAAARGAARVILVARSRDRLEETAAMIGPRAEVWPCDITDAAQIQALADGAGAPDVLINNAGAGAWQHIEEGTAADVRAHMDCPYTGAVMLTRALAPAMIARGSGHILNVTSLASLGGFRGAVTYGPARWAMRGFSEYLRADLADEGIGVTLLNAAEIADTAYFSADNAGAASHSRIPSLFALPLVQAISRDSAQTAAEALDGVERGAYEVLSPWYLAAPAKLFFDLFPELTHHLLRLGSPGRR